ncbi:hypothetical protein DAPPUDRAFT_330809 [Daphnia pulex]|uniref:Uncharacterized protein n=1 Tax=Daphnia pulex TaxID=6669 RepID=E9HKP9_DAPPU|nr:hypothetical protein DAPPUDRAFT_330809 [Daphnia pulex]|eukprot:EFX67699.1 hypothetical protein DAPPUDRAFT_330809 [Daphnia pulex]
MTFESSALGLKFGCLDPISKPTAMDGKQLTKLPHPISDRRIPEETKRAVDLWPFKPSFEKLTPHPELPQLLNNLFQLFAEVNAKVSHFQEDETSQWGFRKIHVNNYQVRRMILPKRPGADDEVSDADGESTKLIFVSMSAKTSLYKNPDGMSRYQK